MQLTEWFRLAVTEAHFRRRAIRSRLHSLNKEMFMKEFQCDMKNRRQHSFLPSGRVMLHALAWLVLRLQVVKDGVRSLHTLEMYCGCGAHTGALASTGLLPIDCGRGIGQATDRLTRVRKTADEINALKEAQHVLRLMWSREMQLNGLSGPIIQDNDSNNFSTNNNSALYAMNYQSFSGGYISNGSRQRSMRNGSRRNL